MYYYFSIAPIVFTCSVGNLPKLKCHVAKTEYFHLHQAKKRLLPGVKSYQSSFVTDMIWTSWFDCRNHAYYCLRTTNSPSHCFYNVQKV